MNSYECRGHVGAIIKRAIFSLGIVMLTLLMTSAPRAVAAQTLFADSGGVLLLKESVRARNPDVLARRAALDAARAKLHATGFGPAASIGAEVEEVPGGLDIGQAGSIRVDLSRELLSGALRGAQRAVAEREVDREQVALQLTERMVGAFVDRALTVFVGATAIAARLVAEDSLLASAEASVRNRFAVGDARYVDVLRLRTERLRVHTDAAATLTEARIARAHLAGILASSPDSAALGIVGDSVIARELRDPLRVPLPSPPAIDSLVALSAASQFGQIAVARAEALRRLARAERRPTVEASIGVQRFAGDAGGYRTGPTLGASVSLPFTARRANKAGIAAADREVIAAEASRFAAVASVRLSLASAYQRYQAARERLTLFDAVLLRGARDEREGALAAYRSGELSLLELLDFERALARAEISRLRSRMEAADALTDLITGIAEEPGDSHAALLLAPEGDR